MCSDTKSFQNSVKAFFSNILTNKTRLLDVQPTMLINYLATSSRFTIFHLESHDKQLNIQRQQLVHSTLRHTKSYLTLLTQNLNLATVYCDI